MFLVTFNINYFVSIQPEKYIIIHELCSNMNHIFKTVKVNILWLQDTEIFQIQILFCCRGYKVKFWMKYIDEWRDASCYVYVSDYIYISLGDILLRTFFICDSFHVCSCQVDTLAFNMLVFSANVLLWHIFTTNAFVILVKILLVLSVS